jgi:putative tryptophan/tyrosine transport system substrate-binding protein
MGSTCRTSTSRAKSSRPPRDLRAGAPARWAFLAAFALATAGLVRPARAAGGTVILTDSSVSQYADTAAAVKSRLSDVTVVDISADDPIASARKAAPKVIVAIGQKALTLVAGRVTDIPIVYATVLYPEKHGLTGSNVTGVPLEIPASAQLARFKQVAPSVKKVGVIYSKDGGALVEDATSAAKGLGLTVVTKVVTSPREVGDALDDLEGRIDALWLVPDAKVINKDVFAYLLRATLDDGIPLFGFLEGFTQAGALASIAPDYADIGSKAAELVLRIIEDPAANLPATAYSTGALSINLKTAQRLGIDVDKTTQKGAKVFK